MDKLTLIDMLLAEGWENYNANDRESSSIALVGGKHNLFIQIYTVYGANGETKEIFAGCFRKDGYLAEELKFDSAQELYNWLSTFKPKKNKKPKYFQVSFKVSRGENCKLDFEDVREKLKSAFGYMFLSNIKIEECD